MSDKKKKPTKAKNPTEANKPKAPKGLLAKIKKQQEDQNKEEEELKRLKEEEERKIREYEAKLVEERRQKELKKEKMKQKKKEKKEREKQEGTYISEKEKKRLREKREKIQLIATELGDEEKPKVVYTKKKNKPKPQVNLDKENDESTKDLIDIDKEIKEETVNSEDMNDEDELDDWDAESSSRSEEEPVSEKVEPIVETKRPIKETKSNEILSEDPMEAVRLKLEQIHKYCESQRTEKVLRSPIACVLGHVDTGKTKLLDKLRHTDVQGGETGGITQQIGATNIPIDHIPRVKESLPDLRLPGLLIIDTPGHESFSNMRSRGSNLCDIAILVVDIMHGVQAQTKESIRILQKRKVPFVIALNKIDRLVEWKSQPDKDVKSVIDSQTQNCRYQFNDRLNIAVRHFAEMNLNVRLFWQENDDPDYVNMVPTSAHTGDGMDDLIAYLCKVSQNKLAKRLSYTEELQASVMEVKETYGHGTTLDIILVNGKLRANDIIVIGGQEGPISTKVRYLLQPAPMAELRVKGEFNQQTECMAAQGVKLVAKDIEKAMPGMPVFRATNDDEIRYFEQELSHYIDKAIAAIKLSDVGVYVQTSTIGSLEALLEYLKQQNVPYSGINIGTIHKKDVTRAAIMREKDAKWAIILAFNVRIEPEADALARELGVRIFKDEIIYRLHDQMTLYLEQLEREVKERTKDRVVFPVKLKILPEHVIQKRNPILVGVRIERGVLRVGTPIVAFTSVGESGSGPVEIGKAMSLEHNRHTVSEARTGEEVCVRIDSIPGEAPRMLGRHFSTGDPLYSRINRDSIDLLKKHYRAEMSNDDWRLIKDMKPLFGIL